MTPSTYTPLESAPHRREIPAPGGTLIVAPGWSVFVARPESVVDGYLRIDPKQIDDLIEALKLAKKVAKS